MDLGFFLSMFKRTSLFDTRLRVVSSLMLVLVAAIVVKLFILQVVQHEYYTAMAMDTHEIYKMLYPRRGTVYFQDARSGREYPAAINRAYYLIYAVPREIERSEIASTTDKLAAILGYDEREKELLTQKLLKENDPYEPIQRKVSDETADRIKAAGLKGVYLVNQDYRYYPEKESGAHVLGFTSFDDSGALRGRYGAEGYWEDVLRGDISAASDIRVSEELKTIPIYFASPVKDKATCFGLIVSSNLSLITLFDP